MAQLNNAPLKCKIREVYGSQEKFAEAVGLSLTSINNVVTGKTSLSRDQIAVWAEALHIPLDSTELNRVFFSA
ncbi:MAG: helix-turn-helix transcriptional regulator [Bacilli bacterium]|nr:helix-turn-helix transcriptional regulator [Bacilli bacterium]